MKKRTRDKIAKDREDEAELREKYAKEPEKVIQMIYSLLVPVAETYKEEGQSVTDQPKIDKRPDAILFRLPVRHENTTLYLELDYTLFLTDEGYGVKVTREFSDSTEGRRGKSIHSLFPPIEANSIKKDIRELLQEAKETIEKLEEERRKSLRGSPY